MTNVFYHEHQEPFKERLMAYPKESCFLLFDENTFELCSPLLFKHFPFLQSCTAIVIPAGESFKHIESAKYCWSKLLADGASSQSVLINVGGGVVSDLGGFVAANYKRGISFIHIPTTLLAMVDAAYGGKNAVNLDDYKNQIGCFAFPNAIYINQQFLDTLNERQLYNGFIEAIKHQLLFNKEALGFLESIENVQEICSEAFIKQNLEYKQSIVALDPFDKKERQALNFGHTIGHALESYYLASAESLLHGEAILLGMIAELKLSEKYLSCPIGIRKSLEEFKARFYPSLNQEMEVEKLINYMKQDKKNSHAMTFSLLKNIAEPCLFVELSEKEIQNVLL